MKEYKDSSGGKSQFLLFVALSFVLYGGYKLFQFLWVKLMLWFLQMKSGLPASEATSIGIIGGADGPTAIFVTTSDQTSYWVHVLLLVVGILGLILIRKKQKTK